jgi:adenine phosphoribosyltransferase
MPLAVKMQLPLVFIRKEGKLPAEKVEVAYQLEYGEAVIEMHKDSIVPGERVLIIDDLLATGGTTNAAVELVEKLQGKVVAAAFVVELEALGGREKMKKEVEKERKKS